MDKNKLQEIKDKLKELDILIKDFARDIEDSSFEDESYNSWGDD